LVRFSRVLASFFALFFNAYGNLILAITFLLKFWLIFYKMSIIAGIWVGLAFFFLLKNKINLSHGAAGIIRDSSSFSLIYLILLLSV
jgi:hypothetical protein